MIKKRPICPQRLRRIPSQFSWVDHRLVRERHIESCSHPAAALYLFLVAVADQEGLSYYSDAAIMSRLDMDVQTLATARQNLIRSGLVAYEDPLYQVLSLEPCMDSGSEVRNRQAGPPVSIGKLFKQMLGENS